MGLKLNTNQKKAVRNIVGPLLIIAGAGTGKTTVITEKIKYLVVKRKIKPENILALTFTEKAATEMETRVDEALPYGYFQMWISTFHAFADQILREEIGNIGINNGYRLMTQAETVMFIQKHLFSFRLKYFRPLGNPNKFLSSLLIHFSRLRDEDVTPGEYMVYAKKLKNNKDITIDEKEKTNELARAYQNYQELKINEGFFDFADLIMFLLQLFRTRPHILQKYRKQFEYVLVDEFQDTNIAQYQLLKLLCPPRSKPRLSVVGDDSQAIYKFRGASVSNIVNFMKDYPTAKAITLNTNYRSNQGILDASYTLIKHNDPDTLEAQFNISKQLVSSGDHEIHIPDYKLFNNVDLESQYVANKISQIKKSSDKKYSDFAILVRANDHADPFISALSYSGIPYRFLGPGMLFKQPEIKELIAYLKTLYNPEDSPSLYRVLAMEIFSIDGVDLALLTAFAKKINLSLYLACKIYLGSYEPNNTIYNTYIGHIPLLTQDTKTKIASFMLMLNRHLGLVKKETAGHLLYAFLQDSGYLLTLTHYKTGSDEKKAGNIAKFFNQLKAWEQNSAENTIFTTVDMIDMSLELGDSPLSPATDTQEYDGVNILTIHSVKGLEFPFVFIVNLSSGRFPTYEKRETIPIPDSLIKESLPVGNYHTLEERRLFYVALTRAKEQVFLTSSLYYGTGKRIRKISPFIIETIGFDAVNKQMLNKKEEKIQLSIFDFRKKISPINKTSNIAQVSFSYSQLQTFQTCPLQYKYHYVIKIPTEPTAPASFGTSIHKTLQQFYLKYQQNKNIDLFDLTNLYDDIWIPVGYSSQKHQQKMKQEGRKMLTAYFKTQHPPQGKVLALEKLFKISINRNLFLTGKIDRADKHANGMLEIIDYKTGRKPDIKKIEKNLQLGIYALAAHDKGLFRQPLNKIQLSIYYLQDNEKITLVKKPDDVMLVKDEIQNIVHEINNNEFPAHVGLWCDFCPFRIICEAWQ